MDLKTITFFALGLLAIFLIGGYASEIMRHGTKIELYKIGLALACAVFFLVKAFNRIKPLTK